VRVYKMTVCWVDHDDLGPDTLTEMIERVRLPNHTINPSVVSVEEAVVEWSDEHPLNSSTTFDVAFEDLFG
jgi:hypothetical protein